MLRQTGGVQRPVDGGIRDFCVISGMHQVGFGIDLEIDGLILLHYRKVDDDQVAAAGFWRLRIHLSQPIAERPGGIINWTWDFEANF